jgi:transcription elongation GreA/GreB family factor
MSRAFIKETDEVQEILHDRLISPHPNLVTPQCLALIERDLSAAAAEYEAAQSRGDRSAIARTAREWRYWTSRRGSAQVVTTPATADSVYFGSTVTISRDGGRFQTFQIVGEDEADPARNLLSYVSPLARALMGSHAGDVVHFGACNAKIQKIE